jgi:hypothetical protein
MVLADPHIKSPLIVVVTHLKALGARAEAARAIQYLLRILRYLTATRTRKETRRSLAGESLWL